MHHFSILHEMSPKYDLYTILINYKVYYIIFAFDVLAAVPNAKLAVTLFCYDFILLSIRPVIQHKLVP